MIPFRAVVSVSMHSHVDYAVLKLAVGFICSCWWMLLHSWQDLQQDVRNPTAVLSGIACNPYIGRLQP